MEYKGFCDLKKRLAVPDSLIKFSKTIMEPRLNPITEKQCETKESLYSRDEWKIVECLDTGMVYLQNPPDYAQLIDELAWEKRFTEEKGRRKAKEPVLSVISSLIKKIRKFIRKKERIETESAEQLKILMNTTDDKELTVVDVGCGTGDKLQKIIKEHQNNHDVEIQSIGIELSQVQSEQANLNLKRVGGFCLHETAIDGLKKISDNTVDLIILCSFLEHELHPLKLLSECKLKLNKKGIIIIKVPNFDSINRKVRQKRWCGFRYPDHVNYFTPETLKLILLNAGLKMTRLDNFPLNDNMWAIVTK